jgi:hypothetical protein
MAQGQERQKLQASGLAAILAAGATIFTGGAAAPAFFTTFALTYAYASYAQARALRSPREEIAARQQLIRSGVAPHRIIYGTVPVSGVLAFFHVQGDYLHLVVAMSGHEVAGIDDVYFDDTRLGALDGSGNVTTGQYAGLVRVKKYLGTDTQTADADLIAASGGRWTSDHRLRGRAYLYLRLLFDQDRLLAVPNIRAIVRGRRCYDPRTGLTTHTENPALIVRDWLTAPFGLGCDAGEVDDTMIATAANVCDQWVTLDTAITLQAVPDHTTDTWSLSAGVDSRITTGDRLVLTGSPVPGGLTSGTTYYLIRLDANLYQLASTYENALARVPVPFTDNGSGTQTWGSLAQRRYTANGSFTLDLVPAEIERSLRSSMAGHMAYAQGKWRVFAGAYSAPDLPTITVDDLRGPYNYVPKRARRDLVNEMRGTYADPARGYAATDFPVVTDAAGVVADGGDTLPRNIDLSWTNNPYRAQRLARIYMRRARAATLVLRLKVSALRVACAQTVTVNIPQIGVVDQTFRVTGVQITGDDGGIGVDLALEAESATTYDWASTDGAAQAVAQQLALLSLTVAAPTNLVLSSGNAELLQGADGSIISRIRAAWTLAGEPNAERYELQFKKATDSEWAQTSYVPASDASALLGPVEDGVLYEVRVRTVRINGARSAWLYGQTTVVGKTQAPAAPTTLTVTPALGGFDIVWSASGEVDYRHSLLYEATSNNFAAATVVATVSGNRAARSGLGAPVTRWYWVRHVDTSGNQSALFPALSGISATTQAPEGGGVPTVANAATITASPGSSPPGGANYWAVYDNTTGKIWRWITANGAYSKAADGGDLVAGSVAADRMAVTQLSSISANLGTVTAGSINIGSGKFDVDSSGNVTIRSAATGARLEVTNSVIRVYDAAGVLRVKLGNLA